MTNADALVDNISGNNSRWCFAKAGELYLVYLPAGGTTDLDLSQTSGTFTVSWFDPRNGGPLESGSVTSVQAGSSVALGQPPDSVADDWLVVVKR
jgi:collagenase-like protein with putative collagen-binding domain